MSKDCNEFEVSSTHEGLSYSTKDDKKESFWYRVKAGLMYIIRGKKI